MPSHCQYRFADGLCWSRSHHPSVWVRQYHQSRRHFKLSQPPARSCRKPEHGHWQRGRVSIVANAMAERQCGGGHNKFHFIRYAMAESVGCGRSSICPYVGRLIGCVTAPPTNNRIQTKAAHRGNRLRKSTWTTCTHLSRCRYAQCTIQHMQCETEPAACYGLVSCD
jgi:hypothetical protein